VVPFNFTQIRYETHDAAGNICAVATFLTAPVSGTKFPAGVNRVIDVSTTTSFDPTTGSGTASFSRYHGGSCNGAAFDKTGATLTATGTLSFVVSDSGNRIEMLVPSFNSVGGNVAGAVFSQTFIRQ
jgi:hypothetical protein